MKVIIIFTYLNKLFLKPNLIYFKERRIREERERREREEFERREREKRMQHEREDVARQIARKGILTIMGAIQTQTPLTLDDLDQFVNIKSLSLFSFCHVPIYL